MSGFDPDARQRPREPLRCVYSSGRGFLVPNRNIRSLRNSQKHVRSCEMYRAGSSLDAIVKGVHIDYYRLRVALHNGGLLDYPDSERPPDRCPCGVLTGVPTVQFCSPEHRLEYGGRRQPDPDNYVTFTCLNCGKEVTKRKKLNYHKYCSNECAAKHTRKKQHIVVEDAIVLDSGYEALFFGLCRFVKLPVERADRSQAVPVGADGWYCPDFYLPLTQLWIETKGFEDDDDRARYAAWRQHHGHLLALNRMGFERILLSLGADPLHEQLWRMMLAQEAGEDERTRSGPESQNSY